MREPLDVTLVVQAVLKWGGEGKPVVGKGESRIPNWKTSRKGKAQCPTILERHATRTRGPVFARQAACFVASDATYWRRSAGDSITFICCQS